MTAATATDADADRRRYLLGLALNVLAAIMYSVANIALRKLADEKSFDFAIFVTGCKGIAAAGVAWVLIGKAAIAGRNSLPPVRFVPTLLIAAFCTHIVGNLGIQYAFALGGLAIVVPIVFSMIIFTGAVLAWLVLREPVTPLLAFAMTLLIAAIAVLSFGADDAAEAAQATSSASTWFVVALAVVSGTGYGCVGVVIRRTRLGGVSAEGTLVLISSSGVVLLLTITAARMGLSWMTAFPPETYGWIALASCCNAVAFFSLAYAYQILPVVRVNLINSSQSAMCAIAGVMLFGEPATAWLVYGTLMTLAGLFLVAYAREKQ